MVKVAILGMGAIGQYIAVKLSQNPNLELNLLARSNYKEIKENGITVSETDSETETLIPSNRFMIVNNIKELPQCDFVIICVKVNQTEALLNNIQFICHTKTKIITLQNGLNFEKEIESALSKNMSLYSGTCWIKVSKLGLNKIRHDFGSLIQLGRYSSSSNINPITEADKSIIELFTQEGVKFEFGNSVRSIQLTKLALNVPFFTLAAETGKNVSEIIFDKELNRVRADLQNEIVSAAALLDLSVNIGHINRVLADLQKMQNIPPSSRTDFIERMRQELPQNTGNLLEFFRSHGINLPQLNLHYLTIFPENHNFPRMSCL